MPTLRWFLFSLSIQGGNCADGAEKNFRSDGDVERPVPVLGKYWNSGLAVVVLVLALVVVVVVIVVALVVVVVVVVLLVVV